MKLLWNTQYIYGRYKQKTCERNGIETIADNDGILWLNEKEGVDHTKLWKITTKSHSDHRKQRYELTDEPKNNAIEFL